MKDITGEWLKSAESDLRLIGKIIEDENLTHLSAFHAQQVVEKSFKAIIEEFGIGQSRIHSLENLYEKVKNKISRNYKIDLFILLDQLYIDARYPGEMGLLPEGKPSLVETQEFYDLATDIYNLALQICKENY
jgi:HEPN domain-containing protein